ncbi:MAG: hypothetical protein RBR49_12530 [Desulfovibrio desulfuricans]|nr:hypothetical protein [Desulfovibrio desulfuricans]
MALENIDEDYEQFLRERYKKKEADLLIETQRRLKLASESIEKWKIEFKNISVDAKSRIYKLKICDNNPKFSNESIAFILEEAKNKQEDILIKISEKIRWAEDPVYQMRDEVMRERTDLLSLDSKRKFISNTLRNIDPEKISRNDLEILSSLIDPYAPKKQGRKGQYLHLVASYWASEYVDAYSRTKSSFGLVGVVDDIVAELLATDPRLERIGEPIGPSSVRRAKERFRPFIDKIIANPEAWIETKLEPQDDEDLEAASK